MSLKAPIGFDVWRHRVRSLTRFITLGKVTIPVVGVFDTGVVSVPVGGTVDVPVPDDEVWLITSVNYDYPGYICVAIYDGVNTSLCSDVYTWSRIGGSRTFASETIPVKGGWVIRIMNRHTSATLRARVTGFKLDASVVTVIGGVIPVSGGSYGTIEKPADGKYFYFFTYAQTVGDGSDRGCIYHCGISGCPPPISCSLSYTEWSGVADDPHALSIYTRRTANFLLLGLGVLAP
jgi:hypothetical protein